MEASKEKKKKKKKKKKEKEKLEASRPAWRHRPSRSFVLKVGNEKQEKNLFHFFLFRGPPNGPRPL